MQTVTTNASGQYQFTNIIEGNYYVTVKLPADYITTVANTADANSNSDFAANSNGSEVFSAIWQQPYRSGFWLVKKLKIGDFVGRSQLQWQPG